MQNDPILIGWILAMLVLLLTLLVVVRRHREKREQATFDALVERDQVLRKNHQHTALQTLDYELYGKHRGR